MNFILTRISDIKQRRKWKRENRWEDIKYWIASVASTMGILIGMILAIWVLTSIMTGGKYKPDRRPHERLRGAIEQPIQERAPVSRSVR